MGQLEEDEDKEFQEILEAKRHKELVDSMGKVASVMASKQADVTSAIEKNTKEIGKFVEKIGEIKPEVKVETNQESVIEAIHKMAIDIKKALETQNLLLDELIKPKEGTFKLIKNSSGWTEAIEYKQKK